VTRRGGRYERCLASTHRLTRAEVTCDSPPDRPHLCHVPFSGWRRSWRCRRGINADKQSNPTLRQVPVLRGSAGAMGPSVFSVVGESVVFAWVGSTRSFEQDRSRPGAVTCGTSGTPFERNLTETTCPFARRGDDDAKDTPQERERERQVVNKRVLQWCLPFRITLSWNTIPGGRHAHIKSG